MGFPPLYLLQGVWTPERRIRAPSLTNTVASTPYRSREKSGQCQTLPSSHVIRMTCEGDKVDFLGQASKFRDTLNAVSAQPLRCHGV